MTGTRSIDEVLHRAKRRGKRRCSRKKCALRIPLIGVCLWSKRVRTKCRRKKRR